MIKGKKTEHAADRPAEEGQCEYVGWADTWGGLPGMRCTEDKGHSGDHLCMGAPMYNPNPSVSGSRGVGLMVQQTRYLDRFFFEFDKIWWPSFIAIGLAAATSWIASFAFRLVSPWFRVIPIVLVALLTLGIVLYRAKNPEVEQ